MSSLGFLRFVSCWYEVRSKGGFIYRASVSCLAKTRVLDIAFSYDLRSVIPLIWSSDGVVFCWKIRCNINWVCSCFCCILSSGRRIMGVLCTLGYCGCNIVACFIFFPIRVIYAPANLQRTPNPCFIGPSTNSPALGYEDSKELFSMGRIDSQWLNRSATRGQYIYGNSTNRDPDFDEVSEGDLFEIVLESSGRSPHTPL